MDIAGALLCKLNGVYRITITQFSVKASRATKQHVGGFGVFGTSQSAGILYSGSFKMSIPAGGLEFDPNVEFGGTGANITVETPDGGFRRGYTNVRLSENDLNVDESAGNVEVSVNWTAEREVLL